MKELDLHSRLRKWNYFEINLKHIHNNLTSYCEQYKDDKEMYVCMEILSEFYENYSCHFRDPTSIEIFHSEEELNQGEEAIDYQKFTVSSWGNESPEIVIIEVYEKNDRTVQSFKSKEEAEIWIEQVEEEGKKKEYPFFLLPDEKKPEWTPYKYNIKGYDKNYWLAECYKIGILKRKLYTLNKEKFDKWFLELMQSKDFDKFYYSIEIIGDGENSTSEKINNKYVLDFYSIESDWEIDILYFEGFCDETPLLFLLQYNFTYFIKTNEFLDYHLVNTFKSDKLKFKTYIKDSLLEFEDKMTFNTKHLIKLKNYIADNLNGENMVVPTSSERANNIVKPKFEFKDTDFYDFEQGLGKLKKEQIDKFLSFLYLETNYKNEPFMQKSDVEKIQEIGLRLPLIEFPFEKFTINIGDNEKWMVYSYFFVLYKKHTFGGKNGKKKKYAEFLDTYFTNFSKTDETSLRKSSDAFVDRIEKIYF